MAATRREAKYVSPDFDVLITGIGKVQAAAAVAAELAREPRELVVNIGACGALEPGLSGLFVPSTVLNHDMSADAIRRLGYTVIDEFSMHGGDGSVLATGDTFVTDVAVRDALANRAALVDMEGFAVVYAARTAGADVRLVKHVSDEADNRDLDWETVAEASARELAAWLETNAAAI